jgi:uncharacterized protein (TIGR03435 family)
MLQSVLLKLFRLNVNRERREVPVYALVIAQGGSKFDPAKTQKPLDRESSLRLPPFRLSPGVTANASESAMLMFEGMEMPAFAHILSSYTGRPVIDKTGLTDSYGFTLRWGGFRNSLHKSLQELDQDREQATLFSALEDQLGLKLQAETATVDFLTIEHVEKPSEN